MSLHCASLRFNATRMCHSDFDTVAACCTQYISFLHQTVVCIKPKTKRDRYMVIYIKMKKRTGRVTNNAE